MKGRLIDSKPLPNTLTQSLLANNQQQLLPHQTQLPIHLTNGITIYPSPSTSTASSTSSSSSTTGPTAFIFNPNGLNLQANGGVGISGNIPTVSDAYGQAGLLVKQIGSHTISNSNDINMSTNEGEQDTGDEENENDEGDESVDENYDGQSNDNGDEEMYDEHENVNGNNDLEANRECENENDKSNNEKTINQKEEQKSITVTSIAKKDEAAQVLQTVNSNTSLNGHLTNIKEESKTKSSQIVLTHVIDGYIIKESTKPFPVKPTQTSDVQLQQQEQEDSSKLISTASLIKTDADINKYASKSAANLEQSYSTPKQRNKPSTNNVNTMGDSASPSSLQSQSTSTNGKKAKASERSNQNASVANTPPKSTSTPSSSSLDKTPINLNSANEALNASISANSVQPKGGKNRNRNNFSTTSSTAAVNEQQQQQQQNSAASKGDSLSSPAMKKSRLSLSSSSNKKNKSSSSKTNNSKLAHTNYEGQQLMGTTPVSAASTITYAQSILLPPPPPPAASIQLPMPPMATTISLPTSAALVSSHSQQSLTMPTLSPFTINSSPSNVNNSSPSSMDQQLPMGDPAEWNCEEVYHFVKCVAGIQVAQLFKMQEVDGSALTLIRDDHLVNTMQIKLGPALKIMSKFNELKSKYNSSS
jgi:hypothetical protein